jgi:hypothetical protein
VRLQPKKKKLERSEEEKNRSLHNNRINGSRKVGFW